MQHGASACLVDAPCPAASREFNCGYFRYGCCGLGFTVGLLPNRAGLPPASGHAAGWPPPRGRAAGEGNGTSNPKLLPLHCIKKWVAMLIPDPLRHAWTIATMRDVTGFTITIWSRYLKARFWPKRGNMR